MKKKIAIIIAATALVFGLTACDSATKNDAPEVAAPLTEPAEVYAMPDGFSNFASRCDGHGNRVYTVYRSWARDTTAPVYGAITVVPQDPSCRGK